jgi:hypothetical protein
MKKTLLKIAAVCAGAVLFAPSAFAAKENPAETNLSPQQIEANYTKAIQGRTTAILNALALSDTNKAARVHDIVIAQWRALRSWHDGNDAKLKAARSDTNEVAQIQASLKKLHNEFIARLSEQLTPEQVETVKDKMTYGVVQATYNAYVEIVPNLTDTDKAKILELLKEGREEAMDAGSSHEKAIIIKKYKGKINIYLTAHGHDVGKAYKDWGARQREKAAANSAIKTNAPAE